MWIRREFGFYKSAFCKNKNLNWHRFFAIQDSVWCESNTLLQLQWLKVWRIGSISFINKDYWLDWNRRKLWADKRNFTQCRKIPANSHCNKRDGYNFYKFWAWDCQPLCNCHIWDKSFSLECESCSANEYHSNILIAHRRWKDSQHFLSNQCCTKPCCELPTTFFWFNDYYCWTNKNGAIRCWLT